MNILAIDPGQTGGIAHITNGVVSAYPMPIAGKEVDRATFGQIVKEAK